MKLPDLIDRLIELHNKYDDDVDVSIMSELNVVKGGVIQFQLQVEHEVSDVAYSKRCGVLIIGQEL